MIGRYARNPTLGVTNVENAAQFHRIQIPPSVYFVARFAWRRGSKTEHAKRDLRRPGALETNTRLLRLTESRRIEIEHHPTWAVRTAPALVVLGCFDHGEAMSKNSAPLPIRARETLNKWSPKHRIAGAPKELSALPNHRRFKLSWPTGRERKEPHMVNTVNLKKRTMARQNRSPEILRTHVGCVQRVDVVRPESQYEQVTGIQWAQENPLQTPKKINEPAGNKFQGFA